MEKFNDFFKNLNTPILICENNEDMLVVYENTSAIRMLNPFESTEDKVREKIAVREILPMDEKAWKEFIQLLEKSDNIPSYNAVVRIYSGERFSIKIAANMVHVADDTFIQIAILETEKQENTDNYFQALDTVFRIIHDTRDSETAIERILMFAGEWTKSSRSYIFESISETMTSNTYEWCAKGVVPAIDQLKNLSKEEYSYDDLVNRGLAVIDDIRKMSMEDREILEPQGIKALAIIPIITSDGPLGYVGFDDCENYRVWTQNEVQFLKNIADLLASLLIRRNTENGLRNSLEVLSAVTNNLDSIVFVTDVKTRKIQFANNALAAVPGVSPEDLKGRVLDEVLKTAGIDDDYKNPLDIMVGPEEKILKKNYIWEYKNPSNGKWYLVRDTIIKWIDGRDAQIETATEITHQKEYEAELEYVASMDLMTKTFNRAWGKKLLQDILEDKRGRQENVLVFIDLDGLKKTNDTFGHTAGDEMILDTVKTIKSSIRRSDVFCRWGGDEFILIIRANQEQAEIVMKKIMVSLAAYNEKSERPFKLSFSYGIVQIDSAVYQTVDDLIGEADKRMYVDKKKLR